jgi:hypothetical protein
LNLLKGLKLTTEELMPTQTLPTISLRQKEIVKDYLRQLDKHIDDLKNGFAESTFE